MSAFSKAQEIVEQKKREDRERRAAQERARKYDAEQLEKATNTLKKTLKETCKEAGWTLGFRGGHFLISDGGKVILRASIREAHGTFDGSDDCRNIPYDYWEVTFAEPYQDYFKESFHATSSDTYDMDKLVEHVEEALAKWIAKRLK